MKKISIVLVLIVLILGSAFFFFPELLMNFPAGQRMYLKMEGEQVAEFYFKEGSAKDSLYMNGVIYSGTLDELKKVLEDNPGISTLVLEEVPGSIDDEINLLASREIRKHKINTYIPESGWVASGGTDMFLAGLKRQIHPTARLGVHSWGGGDKKATEYPKNDPEHKKYLDYYKEMKIPESFYWYTLQAAPAEDIHWMVQSEIKKYKVVNSSGTHSEKDELIVLQKELSSDEYRGRGTESNLKTQKLITSYYENIGLQFIGDSYEHEFSFIDFKNKKKRNGVNLIGYIKGKTSPNKYLVIGAHYDHMGVVNDTIYNGADDNASGTSALLVLAKYFSNNPPEHSIIFAAFDAEELGLHGSKHFVNNPPIPITDMKLNINMDMISRNVHNEIYVVGTHYYPQFIPIVDSVKQGISIKVSFGHDDPEDETKDYWMQSSDNGPFFKKGIPNITFSEEDHPDYHRATDDFENTQPEFYKKVVDLIAKFIKAVDQDFPEEVKTAS